MADHPEAVRRKTPVVPAKSSATSVSRHLIMERLIAPDVVHFYGHATAGVFGGTRASETEQWRIEMTKFRVFSYVMAVGAGVLVGGLYAPRAGDASRKLLARRAQKMKKSVKHAVNDSTRFLTRNGVKVREEAGEWIGRGRVAYRAAGKLVRAIA